MAAILFRPQCVNKLFDVITMSADVSKLLLTHVYLYIIVQSHEPERQIMLVWHVL